VQNKLTTHQITEDDEMKQLTRKELQAENDYLRNSNTLLLLGMNDFAAGIPQQIYHASKDGEMRRWYVSRLEAPHGGLIFQKSTIKGQSDYTIVRYLEDFDKNTPYSDSDARLAIEKAMMVRFQKLSA